jgi:uncharacterized protein YjbI with pentapeptide repeats
LTNLQDASLDGARMQRASLGLASLQGTSLDRAALQFAFLGRAKLHGASLAGAQLQGAYLDDAELQGASLDGAQLQGASLDHAELQGASLDGAQLQGASLDGARLQGASLANAGVWRARGAPELDLTDLNGLDLGTKPWEQRDGARSTFSVWRDSILSTIPTGGGDDAGERLSALGPAPENEPKNLIDAEFWKKASTTPSPNDEREKRTIAFLVDLACSRNGAPYVGRGLMRNGRMEAAGSQIAAVAARLRKGKSEQATCLGVKDFTDEDWASLDGLVVAASTPAPDKKTK